VKRQRELHPAVAAPRAAEVGEGRAVSPEMKLGHHRSPEVEKPKTQTAGDRPRAHDLTQPAEHPNLTAVARNPQPIRRVRLILASGITELETNEALVEREEPRSCSHLPRRRRTGRSGDDANTLAFGRRWWRVYP
jgi:hypothetical protein